MNPIKEDVDLSRRKALLKFVIGYSIFQAAFILNQFWHPLMVLRLAIVGIGLLSCGYWAVQLIGMLRIGRLLRQQPQLAEALNDEYVQQKRWKAWKVSFFIVLACQAAIFLVNQLIPFEAGSGALITIWVAVVSSIGAYLYYDREGDEA